jgi:hypothetical protein
LLFDYDGFLKKLAILITNYAIAVNIMATVPRKYKKIIRTINVLCIISIIG